MLMFEVTGTRLYHTYMMRIAIPHREFVVDGSSGLDYGRNSRLSSCFDTVGKGEERIRGHHRAAQIEAERTGLFDGLFECIHTRCLPHTIGAELFVFRQCDCIGLAMLHNLVGKQQVGGFSLGGESCCHRLEVASGLCA